MLKNREGERVPKATFRTRKGHEWVDLTTDDVFKGKTVVVFSLPGAFTPTCSSSHVPRFDRLAPLFRKHGVDEIVCISVNDAFVMNEWKDAQKAENVTFLPDGNGEFTEGMGMLVGKEDLGFGKRSWRYSMLVKDGVIDKMFIEPEQPGDPYQVSDADTMLKYIAPKEEAPLNVAIFTRTGCPHCARAKEILRAKGLEFEELRLNHEYRETTLRAVAASTTVPQVFINGEHIGGSDDLKKWVEKNEKKIQQRAA